MFAFTKYTLEMVADRFNASIPALLRLTKEMQIPIWAELENVESSLYGSWAPEWTFHKSVELQLSDSTLKEIARAQNNTIKEPLICGSMATGKELLTVRPDCRNNNNEVASFFLQCLAKITLTPVDLLIHACDFPKITQALIAEGFQDKHTLTAPEPPAPAALPQQDDHKLPPLDPLKAITGWKDIAEAIGKSADYAKDYCENNGIRVEHDSAGKPWTTRDEIARSKKPTK